MYAIDNTLYDTSRHAIRQLTLPSRPTSSSQARAIQQIKTWLRDATQQRYINISMLCEEMRAMGKSCLIFCGSKKRCEQVAIKLAEVT
jgi:replicative superfamily II helicase